MVKDALLTCDTCGQKYQRVLQVQVCTLRHRLSAAESRAEKAKAEERERILDLLERRASKERLGVRSPFTRAFVDGFIYSIRNPEGDDGSS